MIFYFTGTGNSLCVAKALGKALSEPLVSIAEELKNSNPALTYLLGQDEKVVFVFPVHSWGPAVPVTQFISRLILSGYAGQPIYSVSTCGDECGYTREKMRSTLLKQGLELTDSYSVVMPNNYILMPGFDVDSAEVQAEKLQAAPSRMAAIAEAIREREKVNLYHVGSMPALKSYLIYPLFATFALGRNSFYATDACISCGLCETVCPTDTITLKEGKPIWANTCVQCVACIHCCPTRAIEYGKATLKKGRYHHPERLK